MYGDPSYDIFASGSTGASANTAHLFFGNYEGLSNLNNDDAVLIHFDCDNSLRFGDSPSNDHGVLVQGGSGTYQIPARRAGDTSQLLFANADLGSNASARWTIFRREI